MILNVKANAAVDGSGVCSVMDDHHGWSPRLVNERVHPPQCPETGKQGKYQNMSVNYIKC